MDRETAVRHIASVRSTWDEPLWRNRFDQVQSLFQHCLTRYRDEAIERGLSIEGLDDALYRARSFVEDMHRAFNPAGATALERDPRPARELDGGKPYFAWGRLVGRIWHHDNPVPRLPGWAKAFEQKEIVTYPCICDKEAVINIFDIYVMRPWLSHPWIDWLFLDALVRHEAIALADHIGLIEADLIHRAFDPKSGLASMLFAKAKQKRAQDIQKTLVPFRTALSAILRVYAGLAGEGVTISPTRVREMMVAAETAGARWDPAYYAVIDRVLARDRATWNFSSPSEADWP